MREVSSLSFLEIKHENCNELTMFLRIVLVFLYLIVIFIGARIADVGISFIGVTSLSVISKAVCDAFASNLFWKWGGDDSKNANAENTSVINKEKSFANEFKIARDSENQDEIDLISYSHFLEKVEDTKASVWVVLVKPKRTQPGEKDINFKSPTKCVKEWSLLSKKLKDSGIRTGVYDCCDDQQLCTEYNIDTCSILLAIPTAEKKSTGQIAIHLYDNKTHCNENAQKTNAESICLLAWIQSKLKSTVTMLDSFDQLSFLLKDSKKGNKKFGLNLIYQSEQKSPPLLFSSLSVKFTGRINFVQFKSQQKSMFSGKESGTKKLFKIIDDNPRSYYSYGLKQGEELEYSKIEMFLRTLHPEINDIFFLTLVFVNMTCLLEIFVQKGGPLKRFIYFVWTFTVSNSLLIFIWLPLTKLIQLPEAKPLIHFCLESLQAAMLSNFASIVRKDLLLFSNHLEVLCTGLLVYGMVIMYLKFKLRNRESEWPSLYALLSEDLHELQQFLHSLADLTTPSLSYYNFEEQLENLLHHLARPSLWLLPLHCTDYIQHLVSWKFCRHIQPVDENNSGQKERKYQKCSCKPNVYQSDKSIVQICECVICLEKFLCGDPVKLLPCKHFFHKGCIDSWLLCGNTSNNRKCPVCRMPANLKCNN